MVCPLPEKNYHVIFLQIDLLSAHVSVDDSFKAALLLTHKVDNFLNTLPLVIGLGYIYYSSLLSILNEWISYYAKTHAYYAMCSSMCLVIHHFSLGYNLLSIKSYSMQRELNMFAAFSNEDVCFCLVLNEPWPPAVRGAVRSLHLEM